MTHFEHNLPILRRRAGYTQEGLAEAPGGEPSGGEQVGERPESA